MFDFITEIGNLLFGRNTTQIEKSAVAFKYNGNRNVLKAFLNITERKGLLVVTDIKKTESLPLVPNTDKQSLRSSFCFALKFTSGQESDNHAKVLPLMLSFLGNCEMSVSGGKCLVKY